MGRISEKVKWRNKWVKWIYRKKLKEIDEFEQELKAIKNKYKKKDEYWKILPDGTPNPYGQGFYDYVVSNDVKFSKVPSIREQQMYNTEWNRRTGEPLKPWHEMPTWEKLMRLVGNMMWLMQGLKR